MDFDDFIWIEELRLTAQCGLSAFSFADKRFPVSISLKVRTTPVVDDSDQFSKSYGDVCRAVTKIVEENTFPTLNSMGYAIRQMDGGEDLFYLQIVKEGGVLRALSEVYEYQGTDRITLSIKNIQAGCIIGIYDHERIHKQDVVVDLSFFVKDHDPNTDIGTLREAEEMNRLKLSLVIEVS